MAIKPGEQARAVFNGIPYRPLCGQTPICKGQPPLFKATNPAFSRWQSSFHGGKLHLGRWQSAVSKVTNCSFQGDASLFKVTNWSFHGDATLFHVTNCSFPCDKLLFWRWQTTILWGDKLLFLRQQSAGGNPLCPKWQTAFQSDKLLKVTICSSHRGKNRNFSLKNKTKGSKPVRWQSPLFKGGRCLLLSFKGTSFQNIVAQ